MKKNLRYVVLFYLTLLSVCIFIGVLYAFEQIDLNLIGSDLINSFSIISINNFLFEVGVLSISFLLSAFFIGNLIFIVYLSFKSFSLGFILSSFIKVYGFKGALVSLIYLFIQIFQFIILFILLVYLIKISITSFKSLILRKPVDASNVLRIIKKISIIFIIFVVYNLLLYLLSNFILNLFINIV